MHNFILYPMVIKTFQSVHQKLLVLAFIWSLCREHANQPEHRLLPPLQNNSNEIKEPFSTPSSTPKPFSNFLQSSHQFTTIKISTTTRATTKTPNTIKKKGVFKPTFIHSGSYRHTG